MSLLPLTSLSARRAFVGVFLLLILSAPAAAQVPPPPPPAAAQTAPEEGSGGILIAGGFSFLRDKHPNSLPSTSQPKSLAPGAAIDVLFKNFTIAETLDIGLVGQVGQNVLDGKRINSYAGGARATFRGDPRYIPYVQFLAGYWTCCEERHFAIQPGGGVDVPLSSRVFVRAAVEFLRVRRVVTEATLTDPALKGFFNEQRFWVGLALRIGGS